MPIFTPDALVRVFQGARGIPRLINMICDVALLYGYTEELQDIGAAVVDQVIVDRGLSGPVLGGGANDPSLLWTRFGASEVQSAASDLEMARQIFGNAKKKRP